jgi:hypothetical protein
LDNFFFLRQLNDNAPSLGDFLLLGGRHPLLFFHSAAGGQRCVKLPMDSRLGDVELCSNLFDRAAFLAHELHHAPQHIIDSPAASHLRVPFACFRLI